jgi:uncharacterized repeat protein (TIGR03803 family)
MMRFAFAILFGGMVCLGWGSEIVVLKEMDESEAGKPVGSVLISSTGSRAWAVTSSGGEKGFGAVVQFDVKGTTMNSFSVIASLAAPIAPENSPLLLEPFDRSRLFGLSSGGGKQDAGTLYQVLLGDSKPSLKPRYDFSAKTGSSPRGGLVASADGLRLFGLASAGGDKGNGVVFRVGADGAGYTVVHAFAGGTADGAAPSGTPDLNRGGNRLVGATTEGGANGLGTLFAVEVGVIQGYSILHHFSEKPEDGSSPVECPILGMADLVLYGMTPKGGAHGKGVIYTLLADGSGFRVLHSFAGGTEDGGAPIGTVVTSHDGQVLYGMTSRGGANDFGTIFAIKATGAGYKSLAHFKGTNGAHPLGTPALSFDGTTLYGMTSAGGANGRGVIFALSLPPQ